MGLLQYMSLIEDSLNNFVSSLASNLEESAPNTRNSFYEIYPIDLKICIEGHQAIYVHLSIEKKEVSLNKLADPQFTIRANIKDVANYVLNRKINRRMIEGDEEIALVFLNLLKKSNVDLIYLIDKYFGNNAAFLSSKLYKNLRSGSRVSKESPDILHKKLRELSIRVDRLEALS